MSTELQLDEFTPAGHSDWRAAAEASLKGVPIEKALHKKLREGISLRPIYDPENAVGIPATWPGVAPFLRGNAARAIRCRIAQQILASTPDEFRTLAVAETAKGQDAVTVRLAPAFSGGLRIETADDVTAAFDGVVGPDCPVYAHAGGSARELTAKIDAAGISWSGGIIADPLAAFASNAGISAIIPGLFDDLAAVCKWSSETPSVPKTIGVDGAIYAESGCTAVEEIAMFAASLAEIFRELDARGVPPSMAAPQVLATLTLTSKIFPQIAKIRAARVVAARVAEAFGAPGLPVAIHGRTTRTNKSVLDAHTNMLRVTAEAFVGIVANVESIEVGPYDELTGEPTDFSRRIARNVPIVLLEESGFGRVADAAGGSWYVESLTRTFAEEAWAIFQTIEKSGGMVAALEAGIPQDIAAKSGAALVAATASRREPLIGVNLYPNPDEVTFSAVEPAACTTDSGGSQVETGSGPAGLIPVRAAREYEALRSVAADFRERTGALPSVWLANFGSPRQFKARADFSLGFFAAGGFAVGQGPGCESVDEAVEAAVSSRAPVVVICSDDATYPGVVPAFAAALKSARPDVRLILAGNPGEHETAFRSAGVDDFIHIRVNCLEFLSRLHNQLGLSKAATP